MNDDDEVFAKPTGMDVLREIGISFAFYPFKWRFDMWHVRGNSYVRVGPFAFFTHSPW
jgi:hypothetical protein